MQPPHGPAARRDQRHAFRDQTAPSQAVYEFDGMYKIGPDTGPGDGYLNRIAVIGAEPVTVDLIAVIHTCLDPETLDCPACEAIMFASEQAWIAEHDRLQSGICPADRTRIVITGPAAPFAGETGRCAEGHDYTRAPGGTWFDNADLAHIVTPRET